MVNYNAAPPEEQMKKLLEQNLAYSKQIYLISRKVKSYILWGRIMSFISLLLVVVPLILGVIYLPSLLNNYMGKFLPLGSAGSQSAGLESLLEGTNLNKEDLLKAIQDQGGVLNSYKNILDLYKQ